MMAKEVDVGKRNSVLYRKTHRLITLEKLIELEERRYSILGLLDSPKKFRKKAQKKLEKLFSLRAKIRNSTKIELCLKDREPVLCLETQEGGKLIISCYSDINDITGLAFNGRVHEMVGLLIDQS